MDKVKGTGKLTFQESYRGDLEDCCKMKIPKKHKERLIKCFNCQEPIEGKIAYVCKKPVCKSCIYHTHVEYKQQRKMEEKKKK